MGRRRDATVINTFDITAALSAGASLIDSNACPFVPSFSQRRGHAAYAYPVAHSTMRVMALAIRRSKT